MKNKPLEITPEFTSTTLTNQAGILPFFKFLTHKLSFDKSIDNGIDLEIGSNTKTDLSTILKAVICGFHCDFKRLVQFCEFTKDPVILKKLGINRPIDENTFGHRLNKFTFKSASQLPGLLGKFIRKVIILIEERKW